MMRRVALVVVAGFLVQACGSGPRESTSPGTLGSPTAPTGVATGGGAAGPASVPGSASVPGGGLTGGGASLFDAASGPANVAFPPRNEPFDFRANYLEQKYRTALNRPVGSSFADIEGAIVWTQEYLRYRLGQCSHEDAVARVFDQIDGRPAPPLCGTGTAGFPPRDQSLNFRVRLEEKYRVGLGRQPSATAVDQEGDIVWTQEYLRYRTSGCSHAETIQKIDEQINGRGVQPVCHTPGQPFGPIRSISINEAFNIIVAYHNASGADLGRNSTRESRVAFWFAAVALVHYGHPVFNPAGGDRDWCVKDAGAGRPPSDDVIVRCSTRDYWDLISGAGTTPYFFQIVYDGILPRDQNVYPPPLSSLPR